MNNCLEVDVTTKDYGNENTWVLESGMDSCFKMNGNDTTGKTWTVMDEDKPYADGKTYKQMCCLAEGMHTLTCIDSYMDGWHGGFIEIQGKRFCENFLKGHNQTTLINIGGNV